MGVLRLSEAGFVNYQKYSNFLAGNEPFFPVFDLLSSAPLWLDASDASTITESGGSVSQWDNKGTLENFTQATSADQPTTGVSTLNGLNVIDFASDFLSGSTKSQWKFLHDGTIYFMAAVVKYGTPTILSPLLGNNRTSTTDPGFVKFFDNRSSAAANEYIISNSTGLPFPVAIIENSGITSNTFVVDSALLDPSNATAANRIDYFINSTAGSDTNSSTAALSSANPTYDLKIGEIGTSGSFAMTGSIAELIIVSGADATETNRQAVVDYLNEKWSVF